MEFYNLDDKKIIIDDDILKRYINSGKCGSIYRYNDDTCLKVYDKEIEAVHIRLITNLYHLLKEIDSESLVDIREILFKKANSEKTIADAYLVKFYEESYQDILTLPSEYLIENLELIIDFIIKCSQRYIILDDLKRGNTIFTRERIVLSDPDHYTIDRNISRREIQKINVSSLVIYFNDLIKYSLYTQHKDILKYNFDFLYLYSNKLFPITTNPNKLAKTLTKRLRGYDNPLEYFSNKVNKK